MESVLSEFPLPDHDAGQRIGKIEASRGGNKFAVSIPDSSSESGLTELLCRLPSRFLNKIWVKRGDFVIVDAVDPTIVAVLYPKQIAHIRNEHLWPAIFAVKDAAPAVGSSSDESDSSTDSSDDEIFRNPNHRRPDNSDETSSDSEEEDDDDD